MTARGKKWVLHQGNRQECFEHDDPLALLQSKLSGRSVAPLAGLPPFFVVERSIRLYDVVRYVERLPTLRLTFDNSQTSILDFYDSLVVFDNVTKTMVAIALVEPAAFESPEHAYLHGQKLIDDIVRKLSHPLPAHRPSTIFSWAVFLRSRPNRTSRKKNSKRRCASAVSDILAADIFQVVISQRFEVDFEATRWKSIVRFE